jgi:hypothetical protein
MQGCHLALFLRTTVIKKKNFLFFITLKICYVFGYLYGIGLKKQLLDLVWPLPSIVRWQPCNFGSVCVRARERVLTQAHYSV